MAPEALLRQEYSRKSDVFSFGVVVYEIVTRSDPWPRVPGMQAANNVMNGIRMEIPQCQPVLQEVMSRCWKQDPQERPEFKEILEMIKQTNTIDEVSEPQYQNLVEYKVTNLESNQDSTLYNN